MYVGEDLEKEDFDSCRYKYMDDDGLFFFIEELLIEDEVINFQFECDIKLVIVVL